MGTGGSGSPHSPVQWVANKLGRSRSGGLKRILLAEGGRVPRSIQMVRLLTIAFNAARRRMGPGSRTGTDDADGSICGVARVAAVHQQGPRGERAPVSFGLVKQLSVLHTGRLATT